MVDDAGETRSVLEELQGGQVVVCDGAMGTMLHAAGVPLDRSLPELNLSRPALVRDLHAAYVSAGARLARDAVQRAGHPVLVAGSVGPAASAPAVRRAERAAHVAVTIIESQGSREC
jgi:methionine synthase / methylenetetrahydrofolate reductase(NADPH)